MASSRGVDAAFAAFLVFARVGAMLMLVPGVGSQIYRGLATVIVGGMSISAVFTLLLLPSILRLGESRQPVPQAESLLAQPRMAS